MVESTMTTSGRTMEAWGPGSAAISVAGGVAWGPSGSAGGGDSGILGAGWDDGEAMKAHFVKEGVEDHCEAGEIAEVLKKAQYGIEGEDIGHHHDEGHVEPCGEEAETLFEIYGTVKETPHEDVVQSSSSA